MITVQEVEDQLKKIGFNYHGWGRSETRELPQILLPDEEIFECVNGIYEAGFALLVATNVRVLLIDRKPMNYLTVEDLRFDMINEIDYSHRLLGARITISTGSKTLRFNSYNQPRLRKLITHVQHCMADSKLKESSHQQDQNLHLEQINQQLQSYLLAQHQQQQQWQQMQQAPAASNNHSPVPAEPIRPNSELSDYLYAQSLLEQYRQQHAQEAAALNLPPPDPLASEILHTAQAATYQPSPASPAMAELYDEGRQEIFGKHQPIAMVPVAANPSIATAAPATSHHHFEVNPLKIAYSKLPLALRNRRFGSPSFHDHSQAPLPKQPEIAGA